MTQNRVNQCELYFMNIFCLIACQKGQDCRPFIKHKDLDKYRPTLNIILILKGSSCVGCKRSHRRILSDITDEFEAVVGYLSVANFNIVENYLL